MTEEVMQRALEPAEIAKLEAEAQKLNAETKKLEAEAKAAIITADSEAEKHRADAVFAKARARYSDLEADGNKLRLGELKHDAERAEEKRLKELADDEHHNVYYFKQSVSTDSVDKCITQLDAWVRTAEAADQDAGKIKIIFFSPGGGVMAGMNLFDHILALRQKGWHFTAVTRGYAASMAGILLQAADVRLCGPESYILIHEISSGAVGKIGELEDEVEFIKLIQRRVNDIFVARSEGKVTASKLRAMYTRKDFWLDSKKALELGIIDAIG